MPILSILLTILQTIMKIKLPILFLLIFSFAHAQVPSTWSSSGTYSSGALVLDSNGVTYIAQQDVTVAGTALTDTSYWLSLDAAAPTSAPSTSAPTSTPDTSTVPTETPVEEEVEAKLSNLSTRGYVGTGDSVMIAGFIVSGTGSTTVTIRALGPTIAAAPYNVSGTISDPILTVVDGLGQVVATNDNWGDFPSASSIQSDGRAPTSSAESVVQVSVTQGNYTAIVSGASGATGVSLVEVYDEETGGASIELSNLSTRAYVGTGDSQMIAGFIVGGETGSTSTVTIRALGPTIASAPYNVVGTITDPILTIVDGTGQVVATVDNWESSTSASAITSTSRNPSNSVESAHQFSVSPGNYTAIVGGVGGATGVSLVEVYKE